MALTEHLKVLEWIEGSPKLHFDLGETDNVHIWALVALAVVNEDAAGANRVIIKFDNENPRSRFASAVGFGKFVRTGVPRPAEQPKRTVPLQRVTRFEEIEKVARKISNLLIQRPEAEETRRTLYYILVEFLRNAVQHSQSPGGAVVGAQLMDKTATYRKRRMIQVSVGDSGVGIMRTLQATYPELRDAHEALVMAQQPWVSSQFERGSLGGPSNAGLGLFFIAELAKRTAGKFLLASRGGGLLLQGDHNYLQHHHIQDERAGFPGTLAVFELPLDEIEDYDALIELVQDLARQRIRKGTRVRLMQFHSADNRDILRLGVRVGAEDTAHAQRLVTEHLLPRVTRGESVELDFSGLRVCTQSYLHSLLFLVLREAYNAKAEVFISNASPAVATALDFLESYALPP